MNGQSCATCRFFNEFYQPMELGLPGEEEEFHGNCRRYPRTCVGDNANERDVYPCQQSDDWCGEYQPANPETVEQGAAVMARLVLMGDMTAARALADKLTGGD